MAQAKDFENLPGYMWINGIYVKASEAKIHPLGHDLVYGGAIFEGELILKNGHIFRSVDHSLRFQKTLEAQKMPFEYLGPDGHVVKLSIAAIEQVKAELVEMNNLAGEEAYFRLFADHGTGLGVNPAKLKTRFMAAAFNWGSYYTQEKHDQGLSLLISEWQRVAPNASLSHLKTSANYMPSQQAQIQAVADGADDALMLDVRGYVAEAAVANIFFIDKEGNLHTPIADGYFLNGITRQTIIDIAKTLGIKVIERHIKPEELGNFVGCFTTGSATRIMPVRSIDNHRYIVPHPITEVLKFTYEDVLYERRIIPFSELQMQPAAISPLNRNKSGLLILEP